MTMSTNGAECGSEHPPNLWSTPARETVQRGRATAPELLYPSPPADPVFDALLAQASAEVEKMLLLPIYARLAEAEKVQLHSTLLS